MMIITQGLIDTIRKQLNESIPETGTESDTHFTNMMLTETLSSCDSNNQALFLLWTQKAGLVQADGGNIKQVNAGGESTVMYTKMDNTDMCLATAKGYKVAWDAEKNTGNSFAAATFTAQPENPLW